MKVGFTGTQRGLTDYQIKVLQGLLALLAGVEFHHGDCIGADSKAHSLARAAGMVIVIHPPKNPTKRAWRRGDRETEAKDYLVRNRAIVDETDWLLACPGEGKEQLRSGTWSTVRWARRAGKRITIILPEADHEEVIEDSGETR